MDTHLFSVAWGSSFECLHQRPLFTRLRNGRNEGLCGVDPKEGEGNWM